MFNKMAFSGKYIVFLVIFLILGIFPSSLLFYSNYKDYERKRDLYLTSQHEVLDYFQKELELRYQRVFFDLEYLAHSSLFTAYLETGRGLDELESDWALFSKTSGLYDQIRYLDEKGMEKVRINYHSGTPEVVSPDQLQNKLHRYYFSKLLDFERPTILVSPTDLNIEHNKIEIPYKSIVRFSLPLFNRQGKFDGALILNLYAETLLDHIKCKILSQESSLYVLNPQGYLLAGPREDELWGFMFNEKKNYTFDLLIGVELSPFLKSEEGQFVSEIGMVVYKTISTEHSLQNLQEQMGGLVYDIHFMEPWWKILSIGQKDQFFLLGSLWKIELLFLLLSFSLSYFITFLYVRKSAAEKMRDTYKKVMHEVINTLELTSSMNDNDTGNHIKRVCKYTELLARAYGLSHDDVSVISELASLHDIGKIGVHDSILKKEGKLNDEEWSEMKKHVLIGSKIIEELKINPIADKIVQYHHENWDGTGYINKLRGGEIPLEARIVSLADVYDALRTSRPYKTPLTHEKSREIILAEEGKKFDPELIQCFLTVEKDFFKVSHELSDEDDQFPEYPE